MRPVTRGAAPRAEGFREYAEALPYLVARMERYCSYCERFLPTGLAVEHVQPKVRYPALELHWDNFLLGCPNCNSTKKDRDVLLHDVLLPDRDNTFVAFEYTDDGQVGPAPDLDRPTAAMAEATLALTGQNTRRGVPNDPNLRRVALDRVAQRRETWMKARDARDDLRRMPIPELRNSIVRLATTTGLFSIWMKVFEDDAEMRGRFIDAFTGTAADCFDAERRPVRPRPANELPHGGKS